MIQRAREDFAEPVPGAMLASACREHRKALDRLKSLRDSYANRRQIMERTRPNNLPNARLAHGFARYISTMASGYLIGKPVAYSAPDEAQGPALEALQDAYTRTAIDSVDAELAKDASVYGKGVELVYADENAQPRSVSMDPISAFVVYDTSAQARPMFGVITQDVIRMDGTKDGLAVTVATPSAMWIYRVQSEEQLIGAEPVEVRPHFFGDIPIVEYWNEEDEIGDFEQVNGLIDAYDTLQSDRINDKTQFVNALLVLTGADMEPERDEETGDVTRSPAQQIREDGILSLPEGATAEYLARALSENDVQVLRNSIASDIHKFSMVPDLTDEHFAGNSSGVAMRYKLLGFEQLMQIKERWFREALRERMRLYAAFLARKGSPVLDVDNVRMQFTRSLPVNELETSQMIRNLEGMVPPEQLLAQLPFVDDPAAAAEQMEEHRAQESVREAQMYNLRPEQPPEEDEEAEE